MIDVKDLRVTFGHGADAVAAVQGVSFAVREGESFGLVGESGSGKSTVLRAVVGLNHDWTGSIAVAGAVQSRRREKGFFKSCQMVFQDPYGSLHPRHTIDRILAEPIAIHGLRDADARIDRVLRDVGLGPQFRFRYPHQLSGGQRQRVAIARALAHQPAVILADEPTASLDPSLAEGTMKLLSAVARFQKAALVVVTHDHRLAERTGLTVVECRTGAGASVVRHDSAKAEAAA